MVRSVSCDWGCCLTAAGQCNTLKNGRILGRVLASLDDFRRLMIVMVVLIGGVFQPVWLQWLRGPGLSKLKDEGWRHS
jgi:hypothetical protein